MREMVMVYRIILITIFLLTTACVQEEGQPTDAVMTDAVTIDDLAISYLQLELSMGEQDPGHVDAYFGPEELRTAAIAAALSLDDIITASDELTGELRALETSGDDALEARVKGLLARLLALNTRIAMKQGETISFDDEVRRLFATTLPSKEAGYFDDVVQEIDKLLPGDGPLNERVDTFLNAFNIPEDKLADVIDAAIAECKRRTVEFIDLPADEHFTVEYVTDKPWGGYNWYQGDSVSLIQINTDLPSRISSAVVLGCHEGYPGHHVYNTLLEQNLVKGKGWQEFSLYPLFSPQSLIAEGSGNYGVDLAFPDDERIEFEKSVLFPLAGLDPSTADDYYRLLELQGKLSFSRNEIARNYLDGVADAEQTIEQSMKHGLVTRERAEKGLSFIEFYRSYVINYSHGKEMVAAYIERGTESSAERWAKFETMLSTSMLPEDLEE
jgi:hypothetical protein